MREDSNCLKCAITNKDITYQVIEECTKCRMAAIAKEKEVVEHQNER